MSDNRQLRDLEVAAATDRRSPLFLWLHRHHDEFAAVVRRVGRPNWGELAAKFAEMGLTDKAGNGPTSEGARQTWVKVRKLLGRETAAGHRLNQSAAQPRDEFSPRQDEPPMADDDFSDIERIK